MNKPKMHRQNMQLAN